MGGELEAQTTTTAAAAAVTATRTTERPAPAPPARPAGRSLWARANLLLARFTFRIRLAAVGVLATALVMALDGAGAIAPLERQMYDLRARTCQFGKPPTVPLVHVHVDDAALEAIGKWPWPRRVLAGAIDELSADGAKLIALDMLLPETEQREPWVFAAGSLPPTTAPAATAPATRAATAPATAARPATGLATAPPAATRPLLPTSRPAIAAGEDDDQMMADAIRRAEGKVFLPVTFSWRQATEDVDVEVDIRAALRRQPSLEPDKLRELLVRQRGDARRGDIDRVMRNSFLKIRQAAFLDVMLTPPRRSREQQREVILGPRAGASPSASTGVARPIERFFNNQFDKAEAIWTLWDHFSREVRTGDVDLLKTVTEDGPIEILARDAAGYGFVDYAPDDGGVVRNVPLVVNQRGRMVPQLGLALACAELGVHPDVDAEMEVRDDRITLRPPGRPAVTIPVYTSARHEGRVRVPASFQLPWRGGDDFQTMYGAADGPNAVRHLPFLDVSKIIEMRYRLERNRQQSLGDLNEVRAPEDFYTFTEDGEKVPINLPRLPRLTGLGDDYEALIEQTLKPLARQFGSFEKLEVNGYPGMNAKTAASYRNFLGRMRAVKRTLAENKQIVQELAAARAHLRSVVGGKVVIVGWSAVGAAADFVPTPIHDKCPGAVIHGLVYTSILTGAGMRVGPASLNSFIVALLGLAATWVMVQGAPREEQRKQAPPTGAMTRLWRLTQLKLSPVQTTGMGVTIVLLWIVSNAAVLFGVAHYVLNLAAPLVAVLMVWSLGILAIAAERFRITQLLHGYVDPKLVEYLKRNPEDELFKTRELEITVCFSDIQGFTTLTQKLGPKLIPLLQAYLSAMVTVIRRNGGVVNKFMGDGIMYMFGVPVADGNHAEAALRCCLEMQEALRDFNRAQMTDGLPELTMRCGVNTGFAYCGDAGPLDAREYTALGDTTNLAARLEPANKEFGTLILASDSTRRKVTPDAFFFRPVGKLKLRNRAGCVDTFELVGPGSVGGQREQQQVKMIEGMIGAFQSKLFDECERFAERICGEFGDSKLCDLYRKQCQEMKRDGVDGFEGQIVG